MIFFFFLSMENKTKTKNLINHTTQNWTRITNSFIFYFFFLHFNLLLMHLFITSLFVRTSELAQRFAVMWLPFYGYDSLNKKIRYIMVRRQRVRWAVVWAVFCFLLFFFSAQRYVSFNIFFCIQSVCMLIGTKRLSWQI